MTGPTVLLVIFGTVLLMSPTLAQNKPPTFTGFTEITGNDPSYHPTPGPAPNPEKCREQWADFFGEKKASKAVLKCCVSYKSCQCIKKVCKENPNLDECTGKNANMICEADCSDENGHLVNITMEQCISLPDAPSSSFWNWLWILILIAIIVILLICVTICCVYWKKFGGKSDSKADRRKGKLSLGPMNISSKVHWKSKHKGSHHKGHHKGSHHKGGETSKLGGSSMKQSMKKSTSMNTRKSRKNSGASSGSRR